jgi:hypothetical protein
MREAPAMSMNINGSISSIASPGGWSTWAIASASNQYLLHHAVFST